MVVTLGVLYNNLLLILFVENRMTDVQKKCYVVNRCTKCFIEILIQRTSVFIISEFTQVNCHSKLLSFGVPTKFLYLLPLVQTIGCVLAMVKKIIIIQKN